MRQFTFALGALSVGALACGGSDGPGVAVSWQVRCNMQMNCLDTPVRTVDNLTEPEEGEDEAPETDVRSRCNIDRLDSGNYALSFRAFEGTEFGIELLQAIYDPETGVVLGDRGCEFEVQEENLFAGSCGSASPSPAQPCQFSRIDITGDGDNTFVSGSILCENLEAKLIPTMEREVTSPADPAAPFAFRFRNCAGL